ncbi:MAG: hypothetical protein NUV52_03115 [Candidatus Roizmanbacteria bacterium]|nr:hypothetical protein [Candidatus Roizmanbacteria bacterium]
MVLKKRTLIYVLILVVLSIVAGIGLFLYSPYALYEPVARFIYGQQGKIPKITGNRIELEYISNPYNTHDESVKNYIYSSNNQQLFNGTYGPNYYIGFFDSKYEITDSNDDVVLIRDIKKKDVIRKFRMVGAKEDVGVTQNKDEFNFATVIGVEQYGALEKAQNRLAIINTYGIVGSELGWSLYSKLQKGDMVIITFSSCDILAETTCLKDSIGNHVALGIYKRSGMKQ